MPRALRAMPAVLAMLVCLAAPAAADTVDRHTYRERIVAARDVLAFALTLAPSARRSFVDRAAAMLRETTAIALDDGERVPVDDGRIAARLDVTDDALHAAVADLDLLARAASLGPAVDADTAAEQLRQRVGEHRASDAEMTFLELFQRWLQRLLADLRVTPPDPRLALTIAGGLGLAVLVAVLGILGRDLRERFRRDVVLPELRASGGPDPALHLRRADEALRAGATREAIHELYLYAIAALAAREAVRYDPSLTDRELLARAAAIPNASALRELVGIHDRVWYGLRDAGAGEASEAARLARRAAA